jgi:hypothetical protein
MKYCCLFSHTNAAIASEYMQFDTIEIFEDVQNRGDNKYPDNYRGDGKCTYHALVQCKNCGALFHEKKQERILCLDDGICFFTTYSLKEHPKVWIQKMSWLGGVNWSWSNKTEVE